MKHYPTHLREEYDRIVEAIYGENSGALHYANYVPDQLKLERLLAELAVVITSMKVVDAAWEAGE